MCCLFGLLDYSNRFSAKDKNLILSILSAECEIRGIDATGIAYNYHNQLRVYKRPLPAHKLRYAVPESAQCIMGHTRMTTQGNEKRNYNNHPFAGTVQSGNFALAHNGIITNDEHLRKKESLPSTKIQTDSYIAVQLLEQQNALTFDSLKYMAEKVEGSFTFTALDNRNNLFMVRGNNPFSLCHFSDHGFYLYASTDEILKSTLAKLNIADCRHESIPLSIGEILRIDNRGRITRSSFDASELYLGWGYRRYSVFRGETLPLNQNAMGSLYIQELKDVASCYGLAPEDIDALLLEGFSCDEIEEILYNEYV